MSQPSESNAQPHQAMNFHDVAIARVTSRLLAVEGLLIEAGLITHEDVMLLTEANFQRIMSGEIMSGER